MNLKYLNILPWELLFLIVAVPFCIAAVGILIMSFNAVDSYIFMTDQEKQDLKDCAWKLDSSEYCESLYQLVRDNK